MTTPLTYQATPIDDAGETVTYASDPITYITRVPSPKSRAAALVLCWFLGIFGVHRFYVGKIGTGILMFLTLGGFGIWAFIDFIVILVGGFRDKDRRPVLTW